MYTSEISKCDNVAVGSQSLCLAPTVYLGGLGSLDGVFGWLGQSGWVFKYSRPLFMLLLVLAPWQKQLYENQVPPAFYFSGIQSQNKGLGGSLFISCFLGRNKGEEAGEESEVSIGEVWIGRDPGTRLRNERSVSRCQVGSSMFLEGLSGRGSRWTRLECTMCMIS
jgi:hypothetical protein